MTDTFETSNPQPFDSLGLFTYLRTYARRHDENDPNSTVESWKECITRIVNATNSQLNVGFSKDEKQELFDLLYNLKCSVAGRFLWQLGTRTVDNLGLMSLQNCAFTVCDEPVKPFVWVMNFLMLGAGCGYRISQEDVAKFPRIQSAIITRKDTKDADFIVPDSRQGWVKLLGKVMKSHFYSGAGFSYSCSLLRSKGAPIKSFGGLSSGPEVLCEGIAKINEILNKYAGTKITSVICLDIMNIIGKIVVSGNVRRSAQIALGDATDKEYLQAKRWDLGNVPNWRCYSNNSVICNDINEIIDNDDFWQGYNGNGEPYGLINLKLSRSCGRLGETQYPDPSVQGYNPCVAGDTIIFTEFGPKKVTEIINQKLRVYVDGELYPTTCGFFSTGIQQLYKLKTEEGFTLRATANHLIMTNSGKWVTVCSLRPGDEVKLHEHRIPNYYEDDDNDYEVENVQLFILRKGEVYVENKDGLLEARAGENNPFYATVASVTPDSIEEVFDCTVPNVSAFDANGFYVHNCAEQSLADKETCCLAEVYLPNISSFEELKKCVSYLYRVCKHSLTLPCADSRETQEIVHRNMRMGIGMTGVLQATEEQREWLKPCYEFLRSFDKVYSQFESFPTSVKLTTCKPSGTLSILGRCTSGIHPGFSQYYIRRIRVASESKLINLAKEHGYYVEYVQNFDGSNDYTTQVISFPYSLPEGTVLAENSTAVQQMEYVKWLQTVWSDNSVSVTVYYRKEELPEIKEWLRKNYNDSVKTISFLLHSEHGFKQAPLEKITKEQYEEMVRTTRPILNAEGICYSAGDEKFVGEGECAGGACPLK